MCYTNETSGTAAVLLPPWGRTTSGYNWHHGEGETQRRKKNMPLLLLLGHCSSQVLQSCSYVIHQSCCLNGVSFCVICNRKIHNCYHYIIIKLITLCNFLYVLLFHPTKVCIPWEQKLCLIFPFLEIKKYLTHNGGLWIPVNWLIQGQDMTR